MSGPEVSQSLAYACGGLSELQILGGSLRVPYLVVELWSPPRPRAAVRGAGLETTGASSDVWPADPAVKQNFLNKIGISENMTA